MRKDGYKRVPASAPVLIACNMVLWVGGCDLCVFFSHEHRRSTRGRAVGRGERNANVCAIVEHQY